MDKKQEFILKIIVNHLAITNGILSDLLMKNATTKEDMERASFYKRQTTKLTKVFNTVYEKEMKE